MIIPCIDLMGGKVVQLVQGERLALTLDSIDQALEMFEKFPLLHVIDLDGAKQTGENKELIKEIIKRRPARVGGGIRTVDQAKEWIDLGAEQVILSSALFTRNGLDFEFIQNLLKVLDPKGLVFALDSVGGKVATGGWKVVSQISVVEAVLSLSGFCGGFLCTSVDHEGLLQGTDLNLFRDVKAATTTPITAAGGISTYDEVRFLVQENISVALGMAIYTGKLRRELLLELLPIPKE